MPDKRIEILTDMLLSYFESVTMDNLLLPSTAVPSNIWSYLERNFSNCTVDQLGLIVNVSWNMYKKMKDVDSFEIVTTNPNYSEIKNRKTFSVLHQIIKESEESILITGYSLSKFSQDLLDEILQKSRQGIHVSLYVNDVEKHQKILEKLLLFKGRYLDIYNFKDEADKMRALHAKVVLVDGERGLISSSNLSYHGMMHNIEMGILFDSREKGRSVREFYRTLYKKRLFTRV